jgi:signal recognition particle subunit SRP54
VFEQLTGKLDEIFRKLRGYGKLSERNIQEAMREVRRALLEADVHYKVARDFVAQVEARAIGQEVLRSLVPGQQVIKIVHDELTRLMGEGDSEISFSTTPPTLVMLVGLQGSGKTTAAAKLANHFRSKGRRPMLVAADVYRPAGTEQLRILGDSIGVPTYIAPVGTDPVEICAGGTTEGRKLGCDPVIMDTAGRLHVDDEMMAELERIKKRVDPHEILFVADGMTGQDAVASAKEFVDRLDFDGIVLTKLEGDARGGAALSICSVTGRPIKFVGVGEKVDALEAFHPDRMASRILGMGDMLSLVEKAQTAVDEQHARELERKLRKQEFSLDDFLDQLHRVRGMGSLDQLVGMIPGASKALKGLEADDDALVRTEAVINSMTKEERARPQIINGSRRKRIAGGSGTSVQEVNRLLRDFESIQKMMKRMGRMRVGGAMLRF